MSIPFAFEKQVAVAAVRRACVLTNSVFNTLVKNETLTKDDKSPVTGALSDSFSEEEEEEKH
jgi:3'(2'), 5'-bisphosphate nucleotidase